MRSGRLRLGRGVLCDYCFFGGSAKTALRSDFPLSDTASVTRCDGPLQRLQLDRSPQKSLRWARQLLESLGAPPMSSSFLESLDATPISAVWDRRYATRTDAAILHQTHAMRAAILVSQTFEDPRFLIAVTDIMVFVPPVINGLLPLFCPLLTANWYGARLFLLISYLLDSNRKSLS